MKTIILFLVSIVFFFGCEKNVTESQRPPDSPYTLFRYIKVITQSGELCIHSMAEIDSSEYQNNTPIDINHFYADSNGIIKAIYTFPRVYLINIASFKTIVHKDTSTPWIVQADAILYQSDYDYSLKPFQPHEVVFPD
jgi:energy-coupling factor transporter transmembrane protein EcfT